MNSKQMKNIVFIFLALSITFGCKKDKKEEFKFIPKKQIEGFYTMDIDLFWQAYDYISPNFTKENFQNIYIYNGTAGLKDYALQKQLALSLEYVFQSGYYKNYYTAIRENTQDLNEVIDKSKQAFAQFKEIYTELEVFDVYFLIGALGAGGRISDNGLLIAAEMFSKTTELDISSLSDWHQSVICTKDYMTSIIVHELVHKQQQITPKYTGYKTLLEQSLLEGMADYISHYLLPDDPFFNEHLHSFGDTIEEEIWNAFIAEADMNCSDTEWLYTGSDMSQGYPADMGYYVGYKIIEAYANKFVDKSEAITAMLTNTDYYDIYAFSEYEAKFE